MLLGRRVLPTVSCALSFALTALGVTGCQKLEQPPPPPFQISIHIDSDPGHPLAGAAVLRDNKETAVTGPDGNALITLRGAEGDFTDLGIRCPENYQSPTKPISVTLRRLSDNKIPEYAAACPPTLRRVIVAIRGENGPNLPVMYLNREVARTDVSGAAHVPLALRPGDQFEISLATNEKGNERLRPQNPSKMFVVKAQDELMLFDQTFSLERKAVVYIPRNIPRRL